LCGLAGVLLWEVFSGGATPYTGIAQTELIDLVCAHSGRLAQPDRCPDVVYDLMASCWATVMSAIALIKNTSSQKILG